MTSCRRCNRQIEEYGQSYYYCKTVGFWIWCASGQTDLEQWG